MTAPPHSDWLEHGQNAVLFFGTAFAGFLIFIFGKPIKQAKPITAKPPAKRKQKTTKPTKKAKAKTTKKKKAKQPAWHRHAPLSPEEDARYFAYVSRRDRRGINNEWAGIPL